MYVSKGYDPIARYSDHINIEDIHFLNSNHDYSKLEKIKFKIRHQPEFNSGTLVCNENRIISDTNISGIAPGQFAVIYDFDEKTCIGSAVISE